MSTPKKSRHQEYRDRKAAELQDLKYRAARLEDTCKELRLGRDIVSAKAMAAHKECSQALANYVNKYHALTLDHEEGVVGMWKTINRWKLASAVLLLCFFGLVAFGCYRSQQGSTPSTWSTKPPPPITKLQVITYGFYDKAGVWRSYDNGEPITVQQWKP